MMCCRKLSCLLRRRDDEVLALDLAVLAHLATVGADHGERRLAAERRVGEHDGPALARVGDQGVLDLDQASRRSAVPMPCSSRFIAASRAVPSTSS